MSRQLSHEEYEELARLGEESPWFLGKSVYVGRSAAEKSFAEELLF